MILILSSCRDLVWYFPNHIPKNGDLGLFLRTGHKIFHFLIKFVARTSNLPKMFSISWFILAPGTFTFLVHCVMSHIIPMVDTICSTPPTWRVWSFFHMSSHRCLVRCPVFLFWFIQTFWKYRVFGFEEHIPSPKVMTEPQTVIRERMCSKSFCIWFPLDVPETLIPALVFI